MKTPDPETPPKPDAKTLRQERLARALRDNLRRRKGVKPKPPRATEGDEEPVI